METKQSVSKKHSSGTVLFKIMCLHTKCVGRFLIGSQSTISDPNQPNVKIGEPLAEKGDRTVSRCAESQGCEEHLTRVLHNCFALMFLFCFFLGGFSLIKSVTVLAAHYLTRSLNISFIVDLGIPLIDVFWLSRI